MSREAVSRIALALLLCWPAATKAAPDDAPHVRLKASAYLTANGTVADRDPIQWLDGRLVAADIESITVAPSVSRTADGVRVPRWSITAFEISQGRSRVGPMLIGAAAGGGVGLIVDITAASRCSGPMCGVGSGAPTLLGAAIGAGIGAAVGRARWVPTSADALAPRMSAR